MAPRKNPPPLIEIATEINPKKLKLLKLIGVSGNKKANNNIIKLEAIPLTPPTKIKSSFCSLTYTAINPAIIFDVSIPKPERFKRDTITEKNAPPKLPIMVEVKSNFAIDILINDYQ